ncbi:protein of unknown function [Candidatus Filomicrobium marinum]|uniref:Uncharacterized protein n=1 Tax=Candidatus Filomicrobium marinum TaxID=1608628 RepID=A0A0D6JJK9_9HYPH|nr:protein of unknown function [Candidatus Filomicrobium marinum]CPR22116.1 protein of unknown function [Candidatus Filomicrobium marinum]
MGLPPSGRAQEQHAEAERQMPADAAGEEGVEALGVGDAEFAVEGGVWAFDGCAAAGDTGALKGREVGVLVVDFGGSVEAGCEPIAVNRGTVAAGNHHARGSRRAIDEACAAVRMVPLRFE